MRELLKKKNVVLVKKGTKIKDGVDTGQPCLVIGVSKKIAKKQLKTQDLIPKITDDGQITDVVIQKPLKALNGCADPDPADGCPPHTDEHLPRVGGISIGRGSITGTAGLIVRDTLDGSLVFLTNNHVLCLLFDPNYEFPIGGSLDPTIFYMIQPSLLDGGIDDVAHRIGNGKRAVAMQFGYSGENRVDAAIIDIDDTTETVTDILHKHQGPFPFLSNNEIYVGLEVAKAGRSTGNTTGPVTGIGVAANVTYGGYDTEENTVQFVDQILVETNDRFSMSGDSGSIVTAKLGGSHKIAGLLYAGSDDGKSTLFNPMGHVATEMQIESWDGKVSLSPGALPVQSVHFRCYFDSGEYIVEDASHLAQSIFASCEECLQFQLKSSMLGNVI